MKNIIHEAPERARRVIAIAEFHSKAIKVSLRTVTRRKDAARSRKTPRASIRRKKIMLGVSWRRGPGGVVPKLVGIAMAMIKIANAAGGRLELGYQ